MMAFISGGPLASLTAGILSFLLAASFNQPSPSFELPPSKWLGRICLILSSEPHIGVP